MADPISEYFAALERLKKRQAKINNDTVAIEAGRVKGSIKKSRPAFTALIQAIDLASAEQLKPKNDQRAKLSAAKQKSDDLRTQLDAGLAREISLLAELYNVKKQLAQLTGGKALPLRKGGSS